MSENISLPILDRIQVASPCPARWEDMQGDDVTRFCSQCSLNVHNISAMTAPQAEAFLHQALPRGRVCARFYRRPDGTILTQDCPVGFARLRQRIGYGITSIAAAVVLMVSGGVVLSAQHRASARLRNFQPFKSVCAWLNPIALPVTPTMPTSPAIQGEICISVHPQSAPTAPPPAGEVPLDASVLSSEGGRR